VLPSPCRRPSFRTRPSPSDTEIAAPFPFVLVSGLAHAAVMWRPGATKSALAPTWQGNNIRAGEAANVIGAVCLGIRRRATVVSGGAVAAIGGRMRVTFSAAPTQMTFFSCRGNATVARLNRHCLREHDHHFLVARRGEGRAGRLRVPPSVIVNLRVDVVIAAPFRTPTVALKRAPSL